MRVTIESCRIVSARVYLADIRIWKDAGVAVFDAGNATNFARAPGYPTFNAQTGSPDFTFKKIGSLYKAGTPVVLNDDPGTGSKHVWIAKTRGGSDQKSIRLRATGGHYEIALDGRNAPGLKVMNLLGQAVPKAGASRQKFIIPVGN